LPIKLYPFQAEDYRTIVDRFKLRAYVGHDPGLGKTVLSLQAVKDHAPGVTVVVCPAGAKEHWKIESYKHIGRRTETLYGEKPRKLEGGRRIYVLNYDILRFWVDELKALRPDLVIIDEAQKIKNPGAKCSKAAKRLCRRVGKVLMLSGTPMPNRSIELWFPISILKPELFPSATDYGVRYCAGVKRYGYWDFSGNSNSSELNQILINEVMVRRKKEDVLKDLPPLTTSVEPFQLPPAAQREYQHAVNNFLEWLATKDKSKARRAIGQEEITKLGYLLRLAAMLKAPQVIDWVKDFLATGQKLILFCVHHDFVNLVHSKFKAESLVVTGDTPMNLRQTIFNRFNDDPKVRLLIGNIQAAGTFWSCRSTSSVALGELVWVPGDVKQAIDRVRGIKRGTGKPVTAYYLTAAGTIEDKLCEVLERKAKAQDVVIDGKRSVDLQLFTYLIEALKKAGKTYEKIKTKENLPRSHKAAILEKRRKSWLPKRGSLKGGKLGTRRGLPLNRKRSPWPRRN
jgi:SWI/SNF-related matrix-associated actin-dependent regulator 1 of chromatin subfamily A